MPIVNPKALIAARQKKGWTQKELSEATKPQINISTISRLERSQPKRIRDATLRELARALGVSISSLCQTKEPERDMIKLPLDTVSRNALALVALRYGVRREQIIKVAPLLFFIVAEQCIEERRKRIAEVHNAADALFTLQSRIRHIPPHWPINSGALDAEEKSINARDLFGTRVLKSAGQFLNDYPEDFDEDTDNPFVGYLRSIMAALGASDEDVEAVEWTSWSGPNYRICAEQAKQLVGGDDAAANAILQGVAALHEMPKGSPGERATWARAQQDAWLVYWGLDELLTSQAEPTP